MAEKIIKAKGRLKFDEHFDKKSESIGIYILAIILSSGITFFVSYFMYGSISELLNYVLNNLILIIITMFIGGLFILKCWMYRRKKIFIESNISKEQLYRIREKGITREIGEHLLFLNWSNINKIIEKDNIFRVYVVDNGKESNFIPYHFFSNNKKIDKFESANPIYLPRRFFESKNSILEFSKILRNNNIKLIKY